jgi:hypothetical protein
MQLLGPLFAPEILFKTEEQSEEDKTTLYNRTSLYNNSTWETARPNSRSASFNTLFWIAHCPRVLQDIGFSTYKRL